MGRIIETRKLYKETINNITQTEENWVKFLDSISWHFKYDFADQVLIYAQRPEARACAELKEWNEKVHRWVNKDARYIFVLSKDEDSSYPFRMVFDVSDTHNYKGTEYELWSVKQEYEEKIIETLMSTFDEEYNPPNLGEAIEKSTYNMVSDNIQDYLTILYKNKNGTKLEYLSDKQIENTTFSIIYSSVVYMILKRCGINTKKYINIDDFKFIRDFNNDKVTTVLGTAISDIAEIELREIAKTVINLKNKEKKLNYTFEKNEIQDYPNNVKNNEGGEKYDTDRIQEIRRLSSTKLSNGERETSQWKIRKNEITLPNETPKSTIFDITNEQGIKQRTNTSPNHSDENGEGNSRETSKAKWSNGRIESKRPNEVDRTYEQLQITSRGADNEGTNIHIEQHNSNFWNPDSNSNIQTFNDEETIEKILQNAPNIKKAKEQLEEFCQYNDKEKSQNYIKKILGEAYNEYYIDNNNIRVGYKSYENGLYMWQGGGYLHRKSECFKEWDEITDYFLLEIHLKENENLVRELPTEEEQKQIITEVENTSVFSFSQEEIDNVLREGSHIEYGKFRIYEFLNRGLSLDKNINFLKNEYGYGGSYFGKDSVSEEHSTKGIRLYISNGENQQELLLSWKQVEKRIRELISIGRYFNPKEQDEYYDWLDANEIRTTDNNVEIKTQDKEYEIAKQLNSYLKEYDIVSYTQNFSLESTDEDNIEMLIADINDTSNLRAYIEFLKDSYEDLDYDDEMTIRARKLIVELEKMLPDYEFNKGDIVYIGTQEYEIRAIDENQVELSDTSFPLISKEMEIEEFKQKVKENSANDKLRTGVKVQYKNKEEVTKKESNRNKKEQENIKLLANSETKQKQENTTLQANIKKKRKNKIEYFDIHPEIPMKDRNNYKIQNNDLGVGTKKEKCRNNINAIRILKLCEEQNRYATTEEQEVLAKYVGWGGLQEAFDSREDNWNTEYNELKSLLTEEEYTKARRSSVTAFYTPPIVIKSIYKALENMGLRKGNILEPSCRNR